ncbi:phosphate regulon transcriptional regulator PhoB [Thorsellia anophelis]|uniref:Phosphate regulon transcriptional regulatory protein PhoB n=1 Tax=Thorsellia anophelis DSM 18579 TaxID=1123402 RepID=A0A1I0DQL0_9GAMM|nr:phosphate regulon transcriptional regulator PhoB [Thorsellia anophelis]SET34698.1 two-component system, OmpR family, phosphate regulon response regulator PhoB [Thorsellia anophelis DSM 18579]
MAATITILIIEDEQAISEMLIFLLQQSGFDVKAASNIQDAQSMLTSPLPDLILLDWMLPGGSGIQLLRQLKRDKQTQSIPVMMLTAKNEESDRVQGLDIGADDYITKPFSPKELIARIKAVLRRVSPQVLADVIDLANLKLDTAAHRVFAGDTPITLGPTEFKLLHFFMSRPERVYSREQLLDHVWGDGVYVEDRTVDVHIRRLRRALEPTGHDKHIQTVRGSGYRFSTQAD